MFTECRLIHADLSEYNMLWHDGKVVFIDVSQSVEPSHPQGLEFLLRDCTNVSNFFTRVGVRDVMTAHRLFNYVSGMEIKADTNEEFLVQVCLWSCDVKSSQVHFSCVYRSVTIGNVSSYSSSSTLESSLTRLTTSLTRVHGAEGRAHHVHRTTNTPAPVRTRVQQHRVVNSPPLPMSHVYLCTS